VTYQQYLTREFLNDMWELADHWRGSITSGCRTVARNTRAGGNPKSRHLFEFGWGLAVDLVFDTNTGREAARVDAEAQGWHTYVGSTYGSRRLHVQAFAPGKPLPKEIDNA
jgi:hypothetical protein